MTRHALIALLAGTSRLLGWFASHWKLALLAAFFASPVGPHIRIAYTYQAHNGSGIHAGHRTYISCTYLGSRGLIRPRHVSGCPFIAFLDAREENR